MVRYAGRVNVEGPFARNKPYVWTLDATTASPVVSADSRTGTGQEAALLASSAKMQARQETALPAPSSQVVDLLSVYAQDWNAAVAKGWPVFRLACGRA